VLAFAAMGVRAAAPPGYMFAAGESGLTVTICGGETIQLDLGQAPAHGQHNTDNGQCLFAVAAHAAPAPLAENAVQVAGATYVVAAPQSAAPRVGQGLAAPPPPSTGPPLFA